MSTCIPSLPETPMSADPSLISDATLLLGPELFVANYKGVVEPRNQLLALDSDANPIPGTYLGRIERISTPLPDFPQDRRFHLEEGFLLYASPWHGNFQHFLTETFPKVVDYLEWIRIHDSVIPLLVPRFMLNGFVEELFQLLGLHEVIEVLEHPAIYLVDRLHSTGYVPNYDPLSESAVAAFKLLRDTAQEAYPIEHPAAPRRIYLARDRSGNAQRNNCNAGAGRVIRNEGELRALLDPFGFEDVFMGDLSIPGKVQALAGAESIASPIGANLMNLLFLTPPYPRRVIILHSTYLTVHALYFRDLLNAVYDGRIRVELMEGPGEAPTENSPYWLDPADFRQRTEGLLASRGSQLFLAAGGRP